MNTEKFIIYEINTIDINYGESSDDFYAQVHCEIMEIGVSGGEAFVAYVASPKRVNHLCEESNTALWLPNLIILNEFSKEKITEKLQEIVNNSKANHWKELTLYLNSFFSWI